MTLLEYEQLPVGATMYIVGANYKTGEVKITPVTKSGLMDRRLCKAVSTTKKGALECALKVYPEIIDVFEVDYIKHKYKSLQEKEEYRKNIDGMIREFELVKEYIKNNKIEL